MTTAELESVLTSSTAATHLTPERWAAANRHLIRKALAEFSHERILVPERLTPEQGEGAERPAGPEGGGPVDSGAGGPVESGAGGPADYRVVSDDGAVEYRFTARRLELDHWSIGDMSIRRVDAGACSDMSGPGAEEGTCPPVEGLGTGRPALHHGVP